MKNPYLFRILGSICTTGTIASNTLLAEPGSISRTFRSTTILSMIVLK